MNCKYCGKPLTGRKRKYCGRDCENKYNNDLHKKPQMKEKKPEAPKKPALSIAEIAVCARAEGLNYGQYVAKYGL